MRQKVILDCDPGHDDAINIMLACASPELELMAVTTTYGNVSLERTTYNARVIREMIGHDFPICAGAELPLMRNRLSAESCHGASGLDGPDLPKPVRDVEPMHAVNFIIESVFRYPHQIKILPTGPLTNLALAMRLEPKIIPLIQEVVLMGGSVDVGNWSPAAEYNILCDPHAARVVFESAAPVTMFGLNITHQAIASPARVDAFRKLGTRNGEFAAVLLEFFREHHEQRYGWDGGALHDPMTAAYLIKPELFEFRDMHVAVETQEGSSYGRTNCDYWRVLEAQKRSKVGVKVDADGFFALLTERIARFP
ncbi:nucleoside hydrolase [Herbaspirillum lusitanum]|uniref:Nucleoside hydrolase n=1 Tax=Herbaspirillum lusitanum TaxID=213312 RepID=A0ABW9AC61_9BURK